MAALPYMQLYVADYLADTAHLTTLEHGAYLLLIMTYWQRGKPLPADARKLARIARLTDDQWAEVSGSLQELFQDDGERWNHKRIDADLAAVEEKSQKARSARAKRTSNERSTSVERTPNHTDTDTESTSNEDTKRASARKPFPQKQFDQFWDAYGHKVKIKDAKAAFVKALKVATFDEIMAGVLRYHASKPKFIAHPTTWLNGERWNDEVVDNESTGPPQGMSELDRALFGEPSPPIEVLAND